MKIEWLMKGVPVRYKEHVLEYGKTYEVDDEDEFFQRALLRGFAKQIAEETNEETNEDLPGTGE